MRILIFGATGMLGHKLVQRLGTEGEAWSAIRGAFSRVEQFGIFRKDTTICDVDITNDKSLKAAIETCCPDVVLNAAGIVKQRVRKPAQTIRVNSVFPNVLAELAEAYRFRLISISTDCVFSGLGGKYLETDPPDSIDLYGRSKLLGEVTGANCLTIRTSLIGRELFPSGGLLEWFLGNAGGGVRGYANAVFSGFPTIVFADIISEIITNYSEMSGLIHISGEPINKFDLLRLINAEYNCGTSIEPDYASEIDRSLDSSKFCRLTGFKPTGWPEMISRMHADPTPYDSWK